MGNAASASTRPKGGKARQRVFWSAVFAGVVVLWLLGFVPWMAYCSHSDAGTFGDSFGWISSLFSALAFLGIILTISLQSRELELQRAELRMTRKELKGQREAAQRTAESQAIVAEAQKESHAILERQADTQFLSAYLNSIIALQEAEPLEYMGTDREAFNQTLRTLVSSLQQKASQCAGTNIVFPTEDQVIAARLVRIARSFRRKWDTLLRLTEDKGTLVRKGGEITAESQRRLEALPPVRQEFEKLLDEALQAVRTVAIVLNPVARGELNEAEVAHKVEQAKFRLGSLADAYTDAADHA